MSAVSLKQGAVPAGRPSHSLTLPLMGPHVWQDVPHRNRSGTICSTLETCVPLPVHLHQTGCLFLVIVRTVRGKLCHLIFLDCALQYCIANVSRGALAELSGLILWFVKLEKIPDLCRLQFGFATCDASRISAGSQDVRHGWGNSGYSGCISATGQAL